MWRHDVILRGTAQRIRAAGEAQVTSDGAQCGFDEGHSAVESEAGGFLRRLHRHERARDLGQTVARGVVLRVNV